MSDNFTNEQKYIFELIKWGKSQLGKANLSVLPPPDHFHLDEHVKQQIIHIYNETSIQSGKKKKTKYYRTLHNKKSKKNRFKNY